MQSSAVFSSASAEEGPVEGTRLEERPETVTPISAGREAGEDEIRGTKGARVPKVASADIDFPDAENTGPKDEEMAEEEPPSTVGDEGPKKVEEEEGVKAFFTEEAKGIENEVEELMRCDKREKDCEGDGNTEEGVAEGDEGVSALPRKDEEMPPVAPPLTPNVVDLASSAEQSTGMDTEADEPELEEAESADAVLRSSRYSCADAVMAEEPRGPAGPAPQEGREQGTSCAVPRTDAATVGPAAGPARAPRLAAILQSSGVASSGASSSSSAFGSPFVGGGLGDEVADSNPEKLKARAASKTAREAEERSNSTEWYDASEGHDEPEEGSLSCGDALDSHLLA
jgi:hypothetical protein